MGERSREAPAAFSATGAEEGSGEEGASIRSRFLTFESFVETPKSIVLLECA